MSEEISKLVLAVDATQVEKATVSLDALAKAGARAERSGGKMATEYSGLTEATNKMTGAARTAAVDTKKLDNELSALLTRINPTYAGVKQLDQGMDVLDRSMKAGLISSSQYASSVALLEAGFVQTTTATSGLITMTGRSRQAAVSLGREFASGNFTRMPGTLAVMAQGMSATALGLAGIASLLAAGAYAWYKWGDAATEATTRAIAAGGNLAAAWDKMEQSKFQTTAQRVAALREEAVYLQSEEKRLTEMLRVKTLAVTNFGGVNPVTGKVTPAKVGADTGEMQALRLQLQATQQTIANLNSAAAREQKSGADPIENILERERAKYAKLRELGVEANSTEAERVTQKLAFDLGVLEKEYKETEKKLAKKGQLEAEYQQARVDLATAASEKITGIGQRDLDERRKKLEIELKKIIDRAPTNPNANELAGAFGETGNAVQGITNLYRSYTATLQENAAAQQAINESAKAGVNVTSAQMALTRKSASDQINAYGDMAGAAKGFFNQSSDGYKLLHQVEQVYRAFQFASSVASMAQAATETTVIVATDSTKTASGLIAGAARMFSQSGWLGFAGVAAMIALIASMGGKGRGGVGAPSPGSFEGKEANKGTGSVLGDASAESQSIKNSLNDLVSLDMPQLVNSNKMVALLTSINTAISGTTSAILRSGSGIATGGGFVGSDIKIRGELLINRLIDGKIGQMHDRVENALLRFMPAASALNNFLKGSTNTTRSLVSAGIAFGDQTVGQGMEGIDAQQYATIRTDTTKKRAFRKTKRSSSYSTEFSDLDADVKEGLQDIIGGIFDTVTKAALSLGTDPAQVAKLKNMKLDIGKINFMGKAGKEIDTLMSAVFSKLGDSMTKFIIPGIERFQLVGEGLFETLVRVASLNEYVNETFASLGLSVGLAGGAAIDANIAIIEMFGGIDKASESISTYTDKFYSDTEKQAMAVGNLDKQFAAMGIANPTSMAAFRGVVEALDLSTTAGQEMFVSLMNVSGAFASAAEAAEDLSKKLTNKDMFSSLSDYLLASGRVASGSAEPRMPSFAVGTDYVPYDMTANIHKGEMVVDANSAGMMRKYGLQSGNDAMVSEIRSLRSELADLRAANVSIALNTNRTAKVLERFDGNGLPPERSDE